MRKGFVKVSAFMMAMTLLTGCGSGYPNLTQEQEQMVGEYAAKLLLEYDANNRSRLVSRIEVGLEEEEVSLEEEEETSETMKEEVEQPEDPIEDTPVIELEQEAELTPMGSPEEFYSLPEGIVINYQGLEVCDSYPNGEEENVYFALDATEGKRLVVLKFGVENHSQMAQSIDLLSEDAAVRIVANGSYTRNVLTTMLMDDMSTYKGEIPAGESENLVLLAEVDCDVADGISTLMLNFKDDSNSCTIQLK